MPESRQTRPFQRFAVPILLAVLLGGAGPVAADDAGLPWSDVDASERQMMTQLLESRHWPFRVLALMRLERHVQPEAGAGPDLAPLVHARIKDEAWQVRCFAIRTARRMSITIEPEELAGEQDGRVIRTALRHGVNLPADHVAPGTKKLLRMKRLDELLLGLEIAAASEPGPLRDEAARRARILVANMNDSVAIRISRRLVPILGAPREIETAADWRAWLTTRGRRLELHTPKPLTTGEIAITRPFVAGMDIATFSRLIEYLDALRQRDLDMVIVMDATSSMVPMLNETRAGVESFIVFLGDISRTMRIAFVAYRDHDNTPVWEGHPFTTDVTKIVSFLMELQITGGADLPEAVLDGLAACGKLDWNAKAERQIVLVGDARPHDADTNDITQLLGEIGEAGIVVHAVHVPQRVGEEYTSRVHPSVAERYRRQVADHNRLTEFAFTEIARLGGGEKVSLKESGELVPAIMHLTLEEGWWPAFDEFYASYLALCR